MSAPKIIFLLAFAHAHRMDRNGRSRCPSTADPRAQLLGASPRHDELSTNRAPHHPHLRCMAPPDFIEQQIWVSSLCTALISMVQSGD